MFDRRVSCAVALLFFAACSFPEYQVPGDNPSAVSCSDGIRNGDELGVDCGPSCNACPVCGDGMLNGDETGVDCGGSCEPCPRCDDELRNGAESDVDCGGTCAKRCETDQRCRERADCASLVCDSVCQPSNCQDEVRNGRETDVDCGGDCGGCSNGSACARNEDCLDLRCQNFVCVNAGCTDGIVNGTESDVDCGGTQCAPCEATGKCKRAEDCDSRVCSASGRCAAPSCSDTVRNQGESAPDCGGAACGPCAVGLSCGTMADCESGLCQNGTCVPKNPSGQPLSRTNWVLTSSEAKTESGVTKGFDGDVRTVWTSGKPQYAGMYVQLDLGAPEIFFQVLLKNTESPYNVDLPAKVDIYISNDGTFGTPSRSNIDGDPWTWINFSSAQVGRYLRIVVTSPRSAAWSIGEIEVYN